MYAAYKMSGRVALVAGVTGVVGMNLAQRLLREGWKVYGISRRKPAYLPVGIHHLAVDLTEEETCKARLSPVTDVTHVFYATWVMTDTEAENCTVNAAMIEYLIDNLGSKITRFVLVTGTKHYMGPFESFAKTGMNTPFRERQPRVLEYPNFYYNQEDVLFDRASKLGFTWTVARPHTMIGFAPHNKMNLGTSLAVYASICKHLKLPFIFPGGQRGYDNFTDATDADLLAEHLIWEATEAKCANQAFNVVNGDIFKWRFLWAEFAAYFGLEVAEPPSEPLDMDTLMADKGPIWEEIVSQHGLQDFKLQDLTSWWHVTVDVGRPASCPTDMNKSREYGFTRTQDTEKAFLNLFDFLRKNKYIP
jgi:nucleoside-diphosphate-sugar epimerase